MPRRVTMLAKATRWKRHPRSWGVRFRPDLELTLSRACAGSGVHRTPYSPGVHRPKPRKPEGRLDWAGGLRVISTRLPGSQGT